MPYSFFCSFYTKSTEPLNSQPASPVLALLSHAHQREFLTIRLAHLTLSGQLGPAISRKYDNKTEGGVPNGS